MLEAYPSGQHFSVDVTLADVYGLNCAFLIHHFQHWIRFNRDRARNRRDGRTWTYQTYDEIASHFPFLNYDQVRYAIDKLVERGVILKANYNKRHMDKTCWFAFSEEENFVPFMKGKSKDVYERENYDPDENLVENTRENKKMFTKGKISESEEKFPDIPDTKPTDIIKPPTPTPSAKEKPKPKLVGGFSESKKKEDQKPDEPIKPYAILDSVLISDVDKARLTKSFDEPLVTKALAYVTRPSFKIKGTLDSALFYFCRNPDHMKETQDDLARKKSKEIEQQAEKIASNRLFAMEKQKLLWDSIKSFRIWWSETQGDDGYLEITSDDGRHASKIYYKSALFEREFEHIFRKIGLDIHKPHLKAQE